MRIRLHFLFVLCLSLLAVSGSQLVGLSSARAASISSDPLVVIAVDVTAQTRCTLTKTVSLGHSHVFTVHRPCAAGTIIMSQDVLLSQAITAHKSYVQLPSSHASQAVWKQTDQVIENLMRSEGATLRKQSGRGIPSIPQIGCGTSGEFYTNWYPDSDHLAAWVIYYRYQDCSTIAIDSAGVIGFTSSNGLWWDHNQYASGWWGTGCPYIGTNNLQRDINSNQPSGYYFEPWVKNSQCIPGIGSWWDINLGPLD
jgi:hypothetical protein